MLRSRAAGPEWLPQTLEPGLELFPRDLLLLRHAGHLAGSQGVSCRELSLQRVALEGRGLVVSTKGSCWIHRKGLEVWQFQNQPTLGWGRQEAA